MLEWLRLPGDIIFIVGGILPFIWIAWLGAATLSHPAETCTSTSMPEHRAVHGARRHAGRNGPTAVSRTRGIGLA